MTEVNEARRVTIFDTTLRDGEQAPGMGMSPDQKVRVALALEELGVDVIEAGFAASSESDAVALRRVSDCVQGARVASLARASDDDIQAAADALAHANNPRIHVFVPCSDLHIEAKLESTRGRVLDQASKGIRRAKELVDDVQFGLEDASRADRAYLADLVRVGIEEGASTIAVADTVGYMFPDETRTFVEDLHRRVPKLAQVVLSIHCHDDLGMGVANSLAAIESGACQVECTINGIGERAGNAALEEIVMAMSVRREKLNCSTSIDTKLLYSTATLVGEVVGLQIPPNKAIVGENAFAHEAGIHQHGVLSNPLTYEIMTPTSVGAPSSRLVFGRHSGRNALESLIRQHGIDLSSQEIANLMQDIKSTVQHGETLTVDKVLAMADQRSGAAASGTA